MLMNYIKKMVGIIKNKIAIKIIFVACLVTSCSHKIEDQENFIKENFINIVDTTAYKYGSFRPLPPLPNDTINEVHYYSDLSIKLNDTIRYDNILQKEINNFFNLNKALKKEFHKLLEDDNYSNLILTSKFPNKIGRYHIFSNKLDENIINKYAGEVEISNFKINKDKALLIVTKSFQNSMIAYIILFIKEDNKWKIVKREPLFVS